MSKRKDPPPPVVPDPGEDTASYIRAMADPELQDLILSAEEQFGPEYVAQELARQEIALFGRDGQGGLIDQAARSAPLFEDIRAGVSRQQREADISDIELFGQRATEAFRAADPEQQALIARQRALTNDLYERAQGVTPQQQRMAEQQAREAYGARGREMDNLGIFAEALGREEIMRQNRQEAQMAGAGLFGMQQATSLDPFMAITGRPANLGYSQASGAQALGMAGNVGPALFNPDAGVNIGMQNAANMNKYNAAIYGADAQRRGALGGGFLGAAGQLLGGGFGSALGGAIF